MHPFSSCHGQVLITALTVGLCLLPPMAIRAQEPDPAVPVGQVAGADSVRLHSQARRAQREFETTHRHHLPRASGPWSAQCEEYLGALCLTDNDQDWRPSSESPVVTSAREHLLEVLAEAGASLPGDHWVLGQRIRYLGDTGRWEEALDLARGCIPTDEWWCHGLRGYVLHRAGDAEGALASFRRALDAMGEGEAEEWTDPTPILDHGGSRWLGDPRGLTRAQAVDRFWALADPLFLTPGNERLSEHYARRFAFSLYEDAALTMGIPWGRGFEALLIRYGFVAGWEEIRPGIREAGVPNVIEHYHPEARGLLPPLEALEDPAGLPRGGWTPIDERPRTASTPVVAPLMAEGQAQTLVLRRDGQLLVVASYGVPRDSIFRARRLDSYSPGARRFGGGDPEVWAQRTPWEISVDGSSWDTMAGLFLLPDTGRRAPLASLGSGPSGVLQIQAPLGGYLLSVEQWSPRHRWGARVRHGVRARPIPQDVPHLSDLLILSPGEALPLSLPEALPRLRATTDLEAGGRITVGWEVYGLGFQDEQLTFGISLAEEEGSFIRRALQRIGLFRRDPVLTLSWAEDGPARTGPLFRAVDLELASLDPGSYVLRLEMKLPHRNPVASSRRVLVF